MGEVLGIVSGLSCTQFAEFYSAEAGVSFWNVASGCRVKRVANDGYSYFFAKNVRVNGIGGIYPKLQWYYLVDFAEKH